MAELAARPPRGLAPWARLSGAALRAAVWLASYLAAGLAGLLLSTLRLRIRGAEHLGLLRSRGTTALLAFWHGKGFVPVLYLRGHGFAMYASHPRDGTFARGGQRFLRAFALGALRHLGFRVLDAGEFQSETRGVVQFMKVLSQHVGMIAPDGPAGPAYRAKDGAAYLGKKAHVVILPVSAAISRGVVLDSWDYFEVPYPFARATVAVGEPVHVPAEASDEDLHALTQVIERVLTRITREAETDVFGTPRS